MTKFTEERIKNFIPRDKTFFPHQYLGHMFASTRRFSFLAFEQRLGKTPTAISVINRVFKHKPNTKCLIVVPAHLKTHWVKELKEWSFPNTYNVSVLNSIFTFNEQSEVFIISDSLIQNKKLGAYLKKLNFSIAVVDEAHRFSNHEASKTKALFSILPNCERAILLSGTPFVNSAKDIYPACKNLVPNLIDNLSYNSFCNKYCQSKMVKVYSPKWNKTFIKEVFSGFKNSRELQVRLLDRFVYRKTFKEVFKDLKVEERILNLELPSLVKSENINNTPQLRRVLSKVKTKASLKFIIDFYEKHKQPVVCFGVHVEALEELTRSLNQHFNCHIASLIYGATSKEQRLKATKDFNSGLTKFMVANVQCVEGLDFSTSSHVVFLESSWTHASNAQAIYRVVNMKKNIYIPIKVFYLSFKGTLDTRVLNVVSSKQFESGKLLSD